MVELLKFSHDREADFRQSCRNLRDTIDAFVEQPTLDSWYDYFEASYSLPRNIVKHEMKAYLSRSYDYRKCVFYKKLFQKERFKSAAKHLAFLSYALCSSRHYPETINTYDVIILPNSIEIHIDKFIKVIDLFGKQNVLIIAQNDVNKPGYKTIYRPEHKLYDRSEVARAFFLEMRKGLRLHLDLSKKVGVNLVPVASNIIMQYLYSRSIFKYNRSRYFIEQRHYGTSAVRNYLFHKFGGTYSCCTQINMQQLGKNGFYYDSDVLFTFGNKSAEWVFDCGARINHIVPVGSTAMECYYFNNNVNRTQEQKYDIVYLGNNIYGAMPFLDTYSTFMDDYYDSFRWLADFSKKNPQLRIGIKKPLKGIIDKMERDIIKNTPIEYIDQRFNSYEVAFQAKCAVTYGSTMGYELLGHGVPVLYIDPGRRNLFLPVRGDLSLEPYRVTDYKDFCQKLETLLSGRFLEGMNNVDKSDFCLDSSKTSEKIYSCLLSGRNKTVQNTIL